MELYWVTTEDHGEDWFIVAISSKEAAKLHEDMEGYTFPGGLPLKDKNGNIIGAIGVSGSSVEDDHEVALAGAAALKK